MQLMGGNRFTQAHPVQKALKALDKTHVIRICLAANKVLFDPFQGEKQAREVLQRLSMKVLQMLEDIAPSGIPVNPVLTGGTDFAVKTRHRKGARFEFVHDRGIQLQLGIVNQHQIPAERLQMAISDDKAAVILANRQPMIRLKDQGQKHFVFGFDQTKLRTFAFEPECPIVREDL